MSLGGAKKGKAAGAGTTVTITIASLPGVRCARAGGLRWMWGCGKGLARGRATGHKSAPCRLSPPMPAIARRPPGLCRSKVFSSVPLNTPLRELWQTVSVGALPRGVPRLLPGDRAVFAAAQAPRPLSVRLCHPAHLCSPMPAARPLPPPPHSWWTRCLCSGRPRASARCCCCRGGRRRRWPWTSRWRPRARSRRGRSRCGRAGAGRGMGLCADAGADAAAAAAAHPGGPFGSQPSIIDEVK